MKPRVVLTFDLDGWRSFQRSAVLDEDILLEKGIPRITEFLVRNRLDATFFVVGQNALDFPSLHESLKDYEIGNHTFSHPTYLNRLSQKDKQYEIVEAHEILTKLFGKAPRVFRAPHYQVDMETVSILKSMSYYCDSSLLRVVYPFDYAFNYIKQRELRHDSFELCLSSFILPFNGTAAINYGWKISKIVFRELLRRHNTLVLNFHAKDFVNISLPRKRLMNRRHSLEITRNFLHTILDECEILSIRQFYEIHRPKN